ncbi:MAG: outer membrane beta-barrel protein [Calditrichaeota bacterium]|nr:outer membrane beta-barrel protein [Calditrichota bacterium]
MKKILFVLVVAVFTLNAQLILKAGINSAQPSVSVGTIPNLEGAGSFMFGAGTELDLVLISIDLEANYVPSTITNLTSEQKNTELQIPATIEIGLPIPVVNPYIRAGVMYSLVLSAESNGVDNKDNFNNYFGLVIGVGVELDLPALPGIIIDGRYIIPTGDSLDDAVSANNFKSNQIQATVGIKL